MKLFKSLLVAPATLGLLAPLSATATEINLNSISNYSNEVIDLDINSFKPTSSQNTLLSGGEGLMETSSYDGGFSETTTASFSVDSVIGAIDGDTTSEAYTFDFQFNIGLATSFTGEDSLDIAIDNGSAALNPLGTTMGFDSGTGLTVDGVTYTFPVYGATMVVGDSTDTTALFSGACAYSAFTDYLSNCGTGNSLGMSGKGVTAAVSYAFDSGFTLAGGVSSPQSAIMGNTADNYAIEGTYSADNYGVALAFALDDGGPGTETTYVGVNGYYVPDNEDFPTISAGFETEENDGNEESGYFLGLSFDEVGPGSVELAVGTTDNFASSKDKLYTYEASYSYPVNDGMTITPGVFYTESATGADDLTGVAVKTSFSF